MRPPQLRCVFFSSMYLPHLLVLPATFWTSVPFATLSVFPSLICGSCPSGQRFAYSFFQIPSHGGHPCCSAMCFVVAYAHLGLSPIRKRPCWANKSAPVWNCASTPGDVMYAVPSCDSSIDQFFVNNLFRPVLKAVHTLKNPNFKEIQTFTQIC